MDGLRRTHPQKKFFHVMCRIIYYLGLGDCWYEETERRLFWRRAHMFWAAISNLYIVIVLIDEILAYFRSDLNYKEINDLVQFTFAHPTICSKIIAFYASKGRIRLVLKRLLEGTRPVYSSMELEKQCVRQYILYCITVIGTTYMTLFVAAIDAFRAYFRDGIPVRIEVTYYPSSATGLCTAILRFFIEFHWWYLVAIMTAIDCLTVCSLLTLGFKFKLLQNYFLNMRTKILANDERKSQEALEEDFKKDFVVGIQLHEDALWCARNVQDALGNLYSIQVFEGVSLLVMCLIKLVAAERNMVYLLANLVFIGCLVLLTGCYMIAAGDVTHEASLVSTAIFHSGWELTRPKADMRVLVIVALQRSQVPVYMTAFGILILSYSNFISVLRSSYSFFAVMY